MTESELGSCSSRIQWRAVVDLVMNTLVPSAQRLIYKRRKLMICYWATLVIYSPATSVICGWAMSLIYSWAMSVIRRMSVKPCWFLRFACCTVCSHVPPWTKAFLEKLIVHHLAKKLLAFYGIRRFITAFTSVRHLTLSWAIWLRSSSSHPIPLTSQCTVRLCFPSGLFLWGYLSQQRVHVPALHAVPAHLILLDLATRMAFVEDLKSRSFSLRELARLFFAIRLRFQAHSRNCEKWIVPL